MFIEIQKNIVLHASVNKTPPLNFAWAHSNGRYKLPIYHDTTH